MPATEDWASLRARLGWLRLTGRDSLHSPLEQSLLARRLTNCDCVAQTRLEFALHHFTQSAGLICHYDLRPQFYLRVTHDETAGRVLGVVLTDAGAYDEPAASRLAIGDWPAVHLRAVLEGGRLQFGASPDESDWRGIGPGLDASKLSDDCAAGFTGAMAGLTAWTGRTSPCTSAAKICIRRFATYCRCAAWRASAPTARRWAPTSTGHPARRRTGRLRSSETPRRRPGHLICGDRWRQMSGSNVLSVRVQSAACPGLPQAV